MSVGRSRYESPCVDMCVSVCAHRRLSSGYRENSLLGLALNSVSLIVAWTSLDLPLSLSNSILFTCSNPGSNIKIPQNLQLAVAAEAPMAAAAAVVDPGLEAAFQATCQAVARLSVAILDEKQPERDLGTAGVKLSGYHGRHCYKSHLQSRTGILGRSHGSGR